MLATTGWAMELEQCVRCSKRCPERASAILDVAAGGIVCRECAAGQSHDRYGGVLSGPERRAWIAAALGDHEALIDPTRDAAAERVLAVVERAFEVHGGGGESG
jgi:DNA repair protein RecO (recombination protein O)